MLPDIIEFARCTTTQHHAFEYCVIRPAIDSLANQTNRHTLRSSSIFLKNPIRTRAAFASIKLAIDFASSTAVLQHRAQRDAQHSMHVTHFNSRQTCIYTSLLQRSTNAVSSRLITTRRICIRCARICNRIASLTAKPCLQARTGRDEIRLTHNMLLNFE